MACSVQSCGYHSPAPEPMSSCSFWPFWSFPLRFFVFFSSCLLLFCPFPCFLATLSTDQSSALATSSNAHPRMQFRQKQPARRPEIARRAGCISPRSSFKVARHMVLWRPSVSRLLIFMSLQIAPHYSALWLLRYGFLSLSRIGCGASRSYEGENALSCFRDGVLPLVRYGSQSYSKTRCQKETTQF